MKYIFIFLVLLVFGFCIYKVLNHSKKITKNEKIKFVDHREIKDVKKDKEKLPFYDELDLNYVKQNESWTFCRERSSGKIGVYYWTKVTDDWAFQPSY